MARERATDRRAALDIVGNLGQGLPEFLIVHLRGEQAEHAQGGYLRLEERRDLAREDDDFLIGDARKEGETEQRIYALNAWRDTPFFDEQEQSILALTEEMTLISHHHVSEDTYNRAAALFEPQYLLDIMMTVITINSWNRLAITTGLQPMAGH